ncbi:60S ribosomal protein L18 isoform X2 [Oncorhynchus tshawytscha]|uniref:Large ribosomal subunit protein uL15/eL18 domain-containing protein n=1 Tax=Oncorhynchus tshawytscha TaxID=74940 RepID=A0AAZ3NMD3_ONCTS|nr:60S ribosomal protein L18 isoform X2 [Oncorhynchus tshawytscha]
MDFVENAGSESESDYLPSPTAPEPEPNVTVKEEEEEGHSDMADPDHLSGLTVAERPRFNMIIKEEEEEDDEAEAEEDEMVYSGGTHDERGFTHRTAVLVGTVTDDVRIQDIPKLKVCALKVTDCARRRIPKGRAPCCCQDPVRAERCTGIFGKACGTPHSHTKPYIHSKGRKFERPLGRRSSRGYKA